MATEKQRKLVKKISENIKGGNGKKTKPMQHLMLESGYSESSAKRSTQVTRSEKFMKLLSKAGISDAKLTRKLNDGLEAKDANKNKDYSVRHRYLMTALELKGLITRSGINVHVGNKKTQINQRILIVRAPGKENIKTVDVEKE